MRLIEQTEKYVVDSEEEALKVVQAFKQDAQDKGYILGSGGYTYKTKKAKGEIIAEAWIVTVTKIFGEVWDDI